MATDRKPTRRVSDETIARDISFSETLAPGEVFRMHPGYPADLRDALQNIEALKMSVACARVQRKGARAESEKHRADQAAELTRVRAERDDLEAQLDWDKAFGTRAEGLREAAAIVAKLEPRDGHHLDAYRSAEAAILAALDAKGERR